LITLFIYEVLALAYYFSVKIALNRQNFNLKVICYVDDFWKKKSKC